ncbi:4'-phosphopantetheinyl transferase superfamily protein [Nocardioides zeae]|uniref:4'-phosphopantetheinyl transferase superfamily protein n=1 Tax=Nocardioides imazamoxiresistens TaxID=3231893 RepID=A0ABU3PV12_9ACTN|nr:4'-phosphopantetheinyl transferase superfamily protein [Nocardioides zeae]MDT9593066.1 4'-phosphopantetheinyl transferase superfamily protein [Nocardioides zeae]
MAWVRSLGSPQARADAAGVRAGLRWLVADVRGDDAPEDVEVRRECPRCARAHGPAVLPALGWASSVSHGGGLVAAAAATHGPVGIDVEHRDVEVVGWALAPAERALVAMRPELFARIWTAKEALLKASGEGLDGDPASLEVDPVALTWSDRRRRPRLRGVRLHALEGPQAPWPYVATLATTADAARVHRRHP